MSSRGSRPGVWIAFALVLAACSIETSGLRRTRPEDAGTRDARARDARARDARIVEEDARTRPACAAPDEDVLALYPFDADEGTSRLTDMTGRHDGALVGTPEWTDGPAGCGRAPVFAPSVEAYGVIPDASDWDLDTGSVDFWIRWDGDVPLSEVRVAIPLSRDAGDTRFPGHFTLVLSESGRLVGRFQTPEDSFVCSDEPIAPDRWTHVGVNFGPPAAEIWIDGVRSTRTDSVVAAFGASVARPCNQGDAPGIAGNDNPWVIGMGANSSAEGEATPVEDPFAPGAIDHLRISRVRRDFAVDR